LDYKQVTTVVFSSLQESAECTIWTFCITVVMWSVCKMNH